MKVALIKLGSRIAISSRATSGGTGEALSIIKMLTNSNVNVDVYTEILSKDEIDNLDFNIYNIEDTYKDINNKNYNALIVLNGNVNYFGGVDSPPQTLNYYIINNFEGKVFYILCDCNLVLKQVWKSIENKNWANNYKKDDINITRNDIIYISQPRDIIKLKNKLSKLDIIIDDIIHYPFEKFPLVTSEYLQINPEYKYDISYGGTFRGGKREKDMIKFYFDYPEDIKVEMFGKITESNFNKKLIENLRLPDFNKAVPYNEFNNKMSDSLATIIIGDPLYKQLDDLAQRIYESILVGNIVFIDSSYDYNKRVFKNEELIKFNYVSNKEEVIDRIRLLKEDKDLRNHIIELQRQDTKIDINKYCNDFVNIIKEKIDYE